MGRRKLRTFPCEKNENDVVLNTTSISIAMGQGASSRNCYGRHSSVFVVTFNFLWFWINSKFESGIWIGFCIYSTRSEFIVTTNTDDSSSCLCVVFCLVQFMHWNNSGVGSGPILSIYRSSVWKCWKIHENAHLTVFALIK